MESVKNVSDVTAHNIRMKALLYWELWEEFALCLQHVHERFAMALLELPRGCDYWNDERMMFMINGTNSTIHEFDGCMYGLKSQFKDAGMAIKKPWRIVSWGFHSLTCMRNVMAHIHMVHVQVEKLAQLNYTRTRL